MGKMRISVIGR